MQAAGPGRLSFPRHYSVSPAGTWELIACVRWKLVRTDRESLGGATLTGLLTWQLLFQRFCFLGVGGVGEIGLD